MELDIGKAFQVRFGFMRKNTYMFENPPHGVVLEHEEGQVDLYVTNAAHNEIYCVLCLGSDRELKKFCYTVASYNGDIMLVDMGKYGLVVDFARKKVASNLPSFSVLRSGWGEDVMESWRSAHDQMFGFESGAREMDRKAAEDFWAWFAENEPEIARQIAAGGDAAREMIGHIDGRLTPVFPYEKPQNIEFQLGCNGDSKEFFLYHFNDEQMVRDTAALGEMMPESVKEQWTFITEA